VIKHAVVYEVIGANRLVADLPLRQIGFDVSFDPRLEIFRERSSASGRSEGE
jgi:hypothetical protein